MNKVFDIRKKKRFVEFEYVTLAGDSLKGKYTPLSSKQRDDLNLKDSNTLREAMCNNILLKDKDVDGKQIVDEVYEHANIYDFFLYLEGLLQEAIGGKLNG